MYKLLLFCIFLSLSAINCRAEDEMKLVDIISPGHYDSVKEPRPLLKWKPYPGAHHYLLRWFEQDPVAGITVKTRQNIITAATEYRFEEDVVLNRVYQWSIEAVDAQNISMTISHCPSFITGTLLLSEIERLEKEEKVKCAAIANVLGVKVRGSGPPFSYGVSVDNPQSAQVSPKFAFKQFDIITGCNGETVKSINDLYRLTQNQTALRRLLVQRNELIGKRWMLIEKELLPLVSGEFSSKPSGR